MKAPDRGSGRAEGSSRGDGPSHGERRPRGPRRWVLPGVALTGAVALMIGVIGMLPGGTAARSDIRDLAGNAVIFEAGVIPDSSTIERMDVDSAADLRFSVPAVGLDVPLAAMNEVDGTITPPGFEHAYWVRNRGSSPASPESGTLFIVMHSLRGGGVGPGNFLIDVDARTSRVPTGSDIRVGGQTYTVRGAEVVSKTALPSNPAVWSNRPGTLVVVTCLQTPDGRASTDNLVITAALVPS